MLMGTLATLVASAYAAHKIEQAMLARKGYDTRNFFKPDPIPAAKVADVSLDRLLAEQEAVWAKHEARLFANCPSAWWLDPTRWGELPAKTIQEQYDDLHRTCLNCGSTNTSIGPDSVLCNDCSNYRHFPELPRPVVYGTTRITPYKLWKEPPPPRCPNCNSGAQVESLTTAGKEVMLWGCHRCEAEFTKRGETKKSKRARRDKRDAEMHPPGITTEPVVLTDRVTCRGCGSINDPRNTTDGSCADCWRTGRARKIGLSLIPDDNQPARPNCPDCGRSHPKYRIQVGTKQRFYECGGCKHTWNAP